MLLKLRGKNKTENFFQYSKSKGVKAFHVRIGPPCIATWVVWSYLVPWNHHLADGQAEKWRLVRILEQPAMKINWYMDCSAALGLCSYFQGHNKNFVLLLLGQNQWFFNDAASNYTFVFFHPVTFVAGWHAILVMNENSQVQPCQLKIECTFYYEQDQKRSMTARAVQSDTKGFKANQS